MNIDNKMFYSEGALVANYIYVGGGACRRQNAPRVGGTGGSGIVIVKYYVII